jgi:hypothetical protein
MHWLDLKCNWVRVRSDLFTNSYRFYRWAEDYLICIFFFFGGGGCGVEGGMFPVGFFLSLFVLIGKV